MTKIRNLVFKGGGVKGMAYVGALHELQEKQLLTHLERVAGTSAGAITAAMVCLQYSPKEIYDIMLDLDFAKFEDGMAIGGPVRVIEDFGWYKGDFFLQWMDKQVKNAPVFKKVDLKDRPTFNDLKKHGGYDLHVFSVDLNQHAVQEFSVNQKDTADVPVSEAVRASMSIPLFFEAWQFPKGQPNKHFYVDGGVAYNFPIETFDTNGINADTLGFYLEDKKALKKESSFHKGELLTYIKATFEALMLASSERIMKQKQNMERTIFIDDLGYKATDFHIKKADKEKLFKSGVYCTRQYLDEHPIS